MGYNVKDSETAKAGDCMLERWMAFMPNTILQSTITWLHCSHTESEMMPTNACQYFYDCKGCGTVLKPKAGDCCG